MQEVLDGLRWGWGVQFVAMVVVGVSCHRCRGYWGCCHHRGGTNHSVASSEGLCKLWGAGDMQSRAVGTTGCTQNPYNNVRSKLMNESYKFYIEKAQFVCKRGRGRGGGGGGIKKKKKPHSHSIAVQLYGP